MTRASEWVDVPRPTKVRMKAARTGEAVAVGYFPAESGSTVPVVGAGIGRRAALAALGAAARVIASDPDLARELGFRTVAVEGVATGAAVRLGKLVRGVQRGSPVARRALGTLKMRADQGDPTARRLWSVAQAQHGRGGVARAAHYDPHVAGAMGATPPAVDQNPTGYLWPPGQSEAGFRKWLHAPVFYREVGWSQSPYRLNPLPPLAADAGTSALLASLVGPRQSRGAISWGA